MAIPRPAVLSAPEMTSPGGELRAVIGAGYLAALFAVGLQPRTDFTINGVVHARELRVPIDAGVRVRHVGQWLELAGDASLVAAIFRAEGVSPVVAQVGHPRRSRPARGRRAAHRGPRRAARADRRPSHRLLPAPV